MVQREISRPVRDAYKGISSDRLKERLASFDSKKGNKFKSYIDAAIPIFTPKEGENCLRILPPIEVEELGYYGFEVHYHSNVGIDEDSFVCLKRTFKKNCPICEKQTAKLWEDNRALAITYYPTERVLMWVMDLRATDEEKEKNGDILLWSAPPSLAKEILLQSHKKGTEVYLDISHSKEGKLVWFTREGKKLQTKYKGVQIGDESYPVDESDYMDSIKKFTECLIDCTYEEIKAIDEGNPTEKEQEVKDAKVDVDKSDQSAVADVQLSEQQQIEQEFECYGKEYGKYQDCSSHCPNNTACYDIMNKPKLPSRSEAKKIAEETVSDKFGINDKLAKAIEARKNRTSSALKRPQ